MNARNNPARSAIRDGAGISNCFDQQKNPEYTATHGNTQGNRSPLADPAFARKIARLHALGPRCMGELLLEIADRQDLAVALDRYARLDPRIVAALGYDRLPAPMLAEVRR